MRLPRAVTRASLAVALFAFTVWNGIFDFLVLRGQRDYLLAAARHAAGFEPAPELHETMTLAIGYATGVAWGWAATTAAAGLGLIWYVRRATLRERG